MTTEEFMNNRAQANAWRLKNYSLLYCAEAIHICNGIGASYFPDYVRRAIDRLHPTLVPASMIHDVEYDKGGDAAARLGADWTFFKNGCKSAWAKFGIDQLRLYLVVAESLWFFILLRFGGQAAWRWRR